MQCIYMLGYEERRRKRRRKKKKRVIERDSRPVQVTESLFVVQVCQMFVNITPVVVPH